MSKRTNVTQREASEFRGVALCMNCMIMSTSGKVNSKLSRVTENHKGNLDDKAVVLCLHFYGLLLPLSTHFEPANTAIIKYCVKFDDPLNYFEDAFTLLLMYVYFKAITQCDIIVIIRTKNNRTD